jgi:hypothetical protein
LGFSADEGRRYDFQFDVLERAGHERKLHYHLPYTLDDGNMNPGTNPVDGIYLVALHVRMDALETSQPFFLVFGPPASTFLPARNAAVTWVQERVDTLVFLGLPGDYNGDGAVDVADYVMWRKGGPLVNEVHEPGTISPEDYTEWRIRFGSGSGSGGFASGQGVPEPTDLLLLFAAILAAAAMDGRRQRR